MGMIETDIGLIDEELIEKRVIVTCDDENERTTRTEYWYEGRMVRRPHVHVRLKRWPTFMKGDVAQKGGK